MFVNNKNLMDFKEKVLKAVSRIPEGKFFTYKKIAALAGNSRAYRAAAGALARNRSPEIFCHRVVRNDNLVGGYCGSEKLAWKKAARLLKEGAVGVIPTDTIYGICASALNQRSVVRMYGLKKRNPVKPVIILIASFMDLEKFGIIFNDWRKEILNQVWPGPVSVILPCVGKKFAYLHRGTETLAFRLPKKKELLKILSVSGPLAAPSANWEGSPPAENIGQAKKYFGREVFYFGSKKLKGAASTLMDLSSTEKKIKILRAGAGFVKIKKLIKKRAPHLFF